MPESTLNAAVAAVRAGKLVVLPTDTVYGIGADPFNRQAVAALLAAKGRGQTMPPPVLGADASVLDLADWSLIPEGAPSPQLVKMWAQKHWPGPLTLVVPTSAPLGWDFGAFGPTVAVRVPDDTQTRELLKITGPLAVTSANLTGQPPALTVQQARDYFGDAVDTYLDGGHSPVAEASTIVDCSVNPPQLVRTGALEWESLWTETVPNARGPEATSHS